MSCLAEARSISHLDAAFVSLPETVRDFDENIINNEAIAPRFEKVDL